MIGKRVMILAVVTLAGCGGCATSAVDSGGDAVVHAAPATLGEQSHRCEPLGGLVYNQAARFCVPDGL